MSTDFLGSQFKNKIIEYSQTPMITHHNNHHTSHSHHFLTQPSIPQLQQKISATKGSQQERASQARRETRNRRNDPFTYIRKRRNRMPKNQLVVSSSNTTTICSKSCSGSSDIVTSPSCSFYQYYPIIRTRTQYNKHEYGHYL